MQFLYNIGVLFYGFIAQLIAPFNSKAKLFTEGRKDIFKKIAQTLDGVEDPIWFHFASLGEFEQGRPVLEAIKKQFPEEKIIITFFSPSGYEIRKNFELADGIFYLPLDTKSNAKRFLQIVNPKMAIFTKYEYWFHYFEHLSIKRIPIYMISAIFRPNQIFFKWYGGFYRKILGFVNHFFVQNEESINLLKGIGFENATISGDTRFDRVYENAINPKHLDLISRFAKGEKVFIGGSTWLEDEKLLANLAKQNKDWKFIIAPHEIHQSHIEQIENLFEDAIKFSALKATEAENLFNKQTLIVDNIGMLSSLYQYGQIAFIGGGFGKGIHNTLEAAAFSLPVIFGPKYDKFQEAKDLISIDAAKSIHNAEELNQAFSYFENNQNAANAANNYVAEKKGATEIILSKIFL